MRKCVKKTVGFYLNNSVRLMIFSIQRKFHKLVSISFILPFLSRSSFSSSTLTNSVMSSFTNKLRIALCQVKVSADKISNIKHIENIIKSTVVDSSSFPTSNHVDLLVLPEIWNSPYSTSSFPVYAELIPSVKTSFDSIDTSLSPSTAKLCELAHSLKIWIIGGSIPEYEDKLTETKEIKRLLYNTCVIINSNGVIVGKHRKMHLFDIDIPGKMTFKESDSLTAGDQVTIFDSPWGKIGVGICYDIRFPEYAMLMRQNGCKLLGELTFIDYI